MLKIKGPGKLPQRASENSVGYDLFANESNVVKSGKRCIIGTGLFIEPDIKEDIYLRIAPRSGLALNHGIDVFAGVIDKDYRGEIKVILFNSGENDFVVQKGDKIAQMIIERCLIVPIQQVSDITETQRGDKGFGSSDKHEDFHWVKYL